MSENDEMSGLIGRTIGQFEIVEEIGRGGMATVYKARQPSVGRMVAIKILPTQFAHDPKFVQRFEREARAIASLEHPHILPLYDFGAQGGLTYMAMRYVSGGDLSNLMGQNLSSEQIAQIVGDIAKALDYAHKNGVIHRDIKPSNILIDDNGEVLLTDFGIAKTEDSQLTGTGMVLGTPDYMAPEQIEGIADSRSDIYALGVVLYELLTGEPPYQAETPLATALKHMNEEIPSPRSINPSVGEPMERVVIKAMAKDPNNRYQSGEEMAAALKNALKQISSSAPTLDRTLSPTKIQPKAESTPILEPSASRSNLRLIIGGGLAILIIVAIGAAILSSGGSGTSDEATAVSSNPAETPSAKAEIIPIESESTPTPQEPTPTPSPEAPRSALDGLLDGEILLQETFNSNKREWTNIEYSDSDGFYSAKIVNERYRLNREAKASLFNWEQPASSGEFDNFIVTIEASPADNSDPFRYGLTFRGLREVGFYTFEVSNAGQFMVRANTTNAGWDTLIDSTPSSAIRNEGTNQLAVQADDSILTFFINGEQVATIEDARFESGNIGVLLDVEAGQKASVDYDDLLVRELSNN